MFLMCTILHAHLLAGVSGAGEESAVLHSVLGSELTEATTKSPQENPPKVPAICFTLAIHVVSGGLYMVLARFQLQRYYKWAQKLVEELDGGEKRKGICDKKDIRKHFFNEEKANSSHRSGTSLDFLLQIPDLALDAIGQRHNNAHPLVSLVSDGMYVIITVMGAVGILATGNKLLIVKCFTVATFLTTLNTISENLTILPPSSGALKCLLHNGICKPGKDCIAYRNEKNKHKKGYQKISTVSGILSEAANAEMPLLPFLPSKEEMPLEGSCTAMMFSGHVFRTMLYMWVFLMALDDYKFTWAQPEPVKLVMMFLVGLVQSILLLVNHEHYSLDIFFAFVLTYMAAYFEPLHRFGMSINPFITGDEVHSFYAKRMESDSRIHSI